MKRTLKRLTFILLFVSFAFGITTGPNFPTAATGSTNTIGGGTVAWTNPGNIQAADGVNATCLPGGAVTDDLRGGGFGFAIASTDTINGITLEVNAQAGVNGAENFNTVVLEGGGGASANRAAGTLGTIVATFTFGGPADLWGTTWTPSQINSGGFVANVSFVPSAAPGIISVDFFRVTVTSTAAPTGMGKRVIRTQSRTVARQRAA